MRFVMGCKQRLSCPADLLVQVYGWADHGFPRSNGCSITLARQGTVETVSGSHTDFDYDNLRLCLTQALPADGY